MSDPSPPLPPLTPSTAPTPGPPVRGNAGAGAATAAAAAGLAQLLIRDPRHTVLVRVRGDSMQGAGINPGDLLVVERRPTASAGQVVVARLRQGLTLKRLVARQGAWWLEAAHPDYPALALGEGRIWGVAIHRIRHLPATSEPALPAASGSPRAAAAGWLRAMEPLR